MDLCSQHAVVLPRGGLHDSAGKQQTELISELVRTSRLEGLRVLNLLCSFEIMLVV